MTTEWYLNLLREKVAPTLQTRGVLSTENFIKYSAPPYGASSVKTFLFRTLVEDQMISRGCKIRWLPMSPNLTPIDFWLSGYLKSLVYRSTPFTPTELKAAFQHIVSVIHPDMLYSAVTGVMTCFSCSLLYGGGHVEQFQLK